MLAQPRMTTISQPILTKVNLPILTSKEAYQLLYQHKVIIITDYGGERDKDVLVRLYFDKKMNDYVTQMSSDKGRTWHIADISLNMISLYPTFEYNKTYKELEHAYMPDDVVRYTLPNGKQGISTIEDVYKDLDNQLYYTVTGWGTDKYFHHKNLKPI